MLVVVASYRQNVHAYPCGGGDYEVATTTSGATPGLTVASALLVDYVLTVAVSISSGVAVRRVRDPRRSRARGAARGPRRASLLTAMNLRGVRESGTAFAIPTYVFMFVDHRAWRVVGPASGSRSATCRWRESAGFDARAAAAVRGRARRARLALPAAARVLLRLRGAHRRRGDQQRRAGLPQAQEQNAATTLALLGGIAVTMFMAIIVLAQR